MAILIVKAVGLVLLLLGSYAILEAVFNLDRPRSSRKARRAFR